MIEGVRDKICIEIVHSETRLNNLISQPNFKSFKIFTPELAAIHMKKKRIVLNKPIAVGFTILDLSKWKMYSFYYKYLKKKYNTNLKLLATDTDSFIIEVETEDFYKDILNDRQLFDTSNFPLTHFLYNKENEHKIGLMKFELIDVIITQFVGLQCKLYAFECEDANSSVKKAKGVCKVVVNKTIKFNHYKICLFYNEVYYFNHIRICSKDHKIHTLISRKRSLNSFDDKRWVLNHPSHQTLALGHYQIQYINKIYEMLGII
jgi:hypothetical protein